MGFAGHPFGPRCFAEHGQHVDIRPAAEVARARLKENLHLGSFAFSLAKELELPPQKLSNRRPLSGVTHNMNLQIIQSSLHQSVATAGKPS